MNTICQKSSDSSSGFDELDDDVFDLEAPIRSDLGPGIEVYSSQLSFAINFEAQPSPNYEFVASDTDSGFNLSFTSLERVSSVSDCGYDTNCSPIAQVSSQPITEQYEENSESNGTQRASGSEVGTIDSFENSSSQREIIYKEEIDSNFEEESIGEAAFLSCIPDSILSIHRRIHEVCTDYSFAYVMAGQMCHRTFPFDCYHSVKLGLMLSVISTHNREMPPISIMTLGRDAITMSTLMNAFREYAERFYTPFGDLKIERSHRIGTMVEANSLLMATNGVCFIGDWSSYKPSCSAYVKNVLDSSRIVVDAQTNMVFPLRCAIWSYSLCCAMKKSIENVLMFSDVFGIPLVFDENQPDSMIDKLLAASGSRDELDEDVYKALHIEGEELKFFFSLVGQRPVCFSDEAELLIKEYFMASRLNRSTLLSQRALGILRQMSESHARLCLRDFVHRNDVIACIVLCEKFIFQVYGIERSNAPFLGPIQNISEVESYMQSFEKWLNANLGVYGRRAGID